jgi:hypothetical protein
MVNGVKYVAQPELWVAEAAKPKLACPYCAPVHYFGSSAGLKHHKRQTHAREHAREHALEQEERDDLATPSVWAGLRMSSDVLKPISAPGAAGASGLGSGGGGGGGGGGGCDGTCQRRCCCSFQRGGAGGWRRRLVVWRRKP